MHLEPSQPAAKPGANRVASPVCRTSSRMASGRGEGQLVKVGRSCERETPRNSFEYLKVRGPTLISDGQTHHLGGRGHVPWSVFEWHLDLRAQSGGETAGVCDLMALERSLSSAPPVVAPAPPRSACGQWRRRALPVVHVVTRRQIANPPIHCHS